MNNPQSLFELRKKELELLQEKKRMQERLPHLYGNKHYAWSRQFFESRNKMLLLCSANQVGKSTVQIRKMIHWATEPKLWPILWRTRPRQFWYLYPSRDVSSSEFLNKWDTELMPREEMKDDPQYGWKLIRKLGDPHCIEFNTGVVLYFKTYTQSVQHLQTGTVHYMACFTAGHLIFTSKGPQKIENLKVGDLVLTRDGLQPIENIFTSEKEVITRKFSNGKSLEGTKDHPIFTNFGWEQLEQLTNDHVCYTVPSWKILENLFYLKEGYTKDLLTIQIEENQGISKIMGLNFMLRSGKLIIKKIYLKVMLSIIKILTLLITGLITLSFFQKKSIQGCTKLQNGKKLIPTTLSVLDVEHISGQDHQKEQYQDFAVKNVEKLHTMQDFEKRDLIHSKKLVYNLKVKNKPEYFCNGILVHNCDEELPVDLYDELMFRLSATNGYFSMAFTATIGQEFWYRALERKGMSDETITNAEKIQVSMYDCLKYEDGSDSPWTENRIHEIKMKCKSEAEVLKRVYGRFVKAEGLKYPCFNRRNNMVAPYKIPPEWMVYSGVDVGSSGESSHRSAICFVAVRPDYRKGVVFRGWRSDRNKTYTAGDVLEMYRVLRGNLRPVLQCYDWGSKDFVTYAARLGESFTKAEKSHDIGENLINILFKNKMLDIFDIEELSSLAVELENLSVEVQKRFSNDDFIDAMRYTITRIPWDYTGITSEYTEEDKEAKSKEGFIDKRRKFVFGDDYKRAEIIRCEDQIAAYNELLEY